MIHKFRDMPANLNTRKNIFVLIDEAHRTTGGDLGNFLMAGLPNASFIGFTGAPVDKTLMAEAHSRPSAARTTRDRDQDEIIPSPDFWADWLARWLALCLPRQEEVHEEVLRKVSLWARS